MPQRSRERACAEIERRIVTGDLAAGAHLDAGRLAETIGADPPAVREALCLLERDGLVRDDAGDGFAVSELDELELREAYPIVLLLEGLAVRTTPEYGPAALARLREINTAMAAAADDAVAAAHIDHDFHEELVGHCANDQLLSTLRPLKKVLLRYELRYMAVSSHVADSVHRHAEIVDALEAGDRAAAAASVEANFRNSLPALLERLRAE